jgi:hypothetical protein
LFVALLCFDNEMRKRSSPWEADSSLYTYMTVGGQVLHGGGRLSSGSAQAALYSDSFHVKNMDASVLRTNLGADFSEEAEWKSLTK